jgi:hypothetical protein
LPVAVSPLLIQKDSTILVVLGVFFAIRGSLAITSLSSVPVFLLAYFLPGVSLDLWLGIYVMFTFCVHLTRLRVSLFLPCVRVGLTD